MHSPTSDNGNNESPLMLNTQANRLVKSADEIMPHGPVEIFDKNEEANNTYSSMDSSWESPLSSCTNSPSGTVKGDPTISNLLTPNQIDVENNNKTLEQAVEVLTINEQQPATLGISSALSILALDTVQPTAMKAAKASQNPIVQGMQIESLCSTYRL